MKYIISANIVTALVLLNSSACTTHGIQHSVLESSPYMDCSANSASIRVDGHFGRCAGINLYHSRTNTSADTNVTGYNGTINFRQRIIDIGDAGITFNATMIDDALYGYGTVDGKFYLYKGPVSIAPDVGIGAGLGELAWMFDARTSFIISGEIIKNVFYAQFSPRLIGLMYPYYTEETGGLTTSYSYTMMPLYGLNAGVTFSLPLAPEDMYIVPRFKITPEVNYLFAKEPKGDEVNLNILQIGCSFTASF
ncbi:hypothetical protein JXB22_07355 [candidate division WOR-3 bacterium]|nr:hypothetical protein [candidate division WOR-3 bacterium]